MRQEDLFKIEEKRFLKEAEGLLDNPSAMSEFITINYDNFFVNIPSGEYKKYILERIYKNYLGRNRDGETHIVQITEGDIRFLQSLPSDRLKRLFYCLKVRAKVKPHPSGWISLDLGNTLLYAFSEQDVRNFKFEELSVCTPYGFETRVSGSTKPVLCFKIPDSEGEIIFEFEDVVARNKYAEVIGFKLPTISYLR